jgi:hypothetical protein
MAEYRAYLVGSDGHFYDAVPLICEDDTEAIVKAKQLRGVVSRWTIRATEKNLSGGWSRPSGRLPCSMILSPPSASRSWSKIWKSSSAKRSVKVAR